MKAKVTAIKKTEPEMIPVDGKQLQGIYLVWISLLGIHQLMKDSEDVGAQDVFEVMRPVMREFGDIMEDLPVPSFEGK